MHRLGGQASQYRVVVLKVPPRAVEARAQYHAQTPCPTFGNAQPSLRRCNQRHADQTILDKQTHGWQILQKMLFNQFADRCAHALIETAAFGVEQISKARFMPISVVQQRAGFP